MVDSRKVYNEAVSFLRPYATRATLKKISRFVIALDPDRNFNLDGYLDRSYLRFEKIFSRANSPSDWLEIGAFFPALPIALSLLGHKVTVVEEFALYPPEIQKMYRDITYIPHFAHS